MPTEYGDQQDGTFLQPPIRPEQRILTLPSPVREVPFLTAGGEQVMQPITQADSLRLGLSPALAWSAEGITGYMHVKLRDRGAEEGRPLFYKFLINPSTVQVNRQTVDAEAFARGGWQTGIWGDTLDIVLQGTTPGQYFAGGLIDNAMEYSLSYRSLMELVSVYENNGYWYEAESLGNSFLPAQQTRRQIKVHADVEIGFGNFLWYGAFQAIEIGDSAEKPYLKSFSLSFMVWKERFKDKSPWRNSIRTETYRGHAYELNPLRGPKPDPTAIKQAAATGQASLAPATISPSTPAPDLFSDKVIPPPFSGLVGPVDLGSLQ